MNRLRPLVFYILLASALLAASCRPSTEDRVESVVKVVEDEKLLAHLEQYSNYAGTVLEVREFVKNIGELAIVCRGISAVLNEKTVKWLLSEVAVAKLAWELVASLEVVQQFWEFIEAMASYPSEFRAALEKARAEPTDDNLARLSAIATAGAARLSSALEMLEPIAEWVSKADFALVAAEMEIARFKRDIGFFGGKAVAGLLKKLVKLIREEIVGKASKALLDFTSQLRRDIHSLRNVIETAEVHVEGRSSCSVSDW